MVRFKKELQQLNKNVINLHNREAWTFLLIARKSLKIIVFISIYEKVPVF